jgi:glyoxylase-like metal-dependent hydrolase (beta-lactamase superfamily II)
MSSIASFDNNVVKSSYEGPGFHVQQLYTGCLAIYSYYIESGNDCFLVDPLLDSQQYKDLIATRRKTLKGIFISHYHADYVSGQYELQKKYNCKIYMGPTSIPTETVVSLKDKETVNLGKVKL